MSAKQTSRSRTGLSRAILLTLERGPATADEVLERLGPWPKPITRGAVWVVLCRAIQNGLARSSRTDGEKKPYHYELTDGGVRRIKWIKGKTKQRLPTMKAVANPKVEEE